MNSRHKLLLIACGIAAAVAACLSDHGAAVVVPSDPLDLVLSQDIQFQIKNPSTLEGVMDAYSHATGRRVVLDWTELCRHGIVNERALLAIDAGFTAGNLQEITSRTLREFATTQPTTDLAPSPTFRLLQGGSLFISIDPKARRCLRMYDVHDMLSDSFWRNTANPAQTNLSQYARLQAIASFIALRVDCDMYAVLPASGRMIWVEKVDFFDKDLIITTTPESIDT